MMDMMQVCWQWMTSFGLVGMAAGVALLVGLLALVVWLIARLAGKGDRPSPR